MSDSKKKVEFELGLVDGMSDRLRLIMENLDGLKDSFGGAEQKLGKFQSIINKLNFSKVGDKLKGLGENFHHISENMEKLSGYGHQVTDYARHGVDAATEYLMKLNKVASKIGIDPDEEEKKKKENIIKEHAGENYQKDYFTQLEMLSKKTLFSPFNYDNTAEALSYLAEGGFTLRDLERNPSKPSLEEIYPSVINLATAAGTDLGETARSLIPVVNNLKDAFGEQYKNDSMEERIARIGNMLAASANEGSKLDETFWALKEAAPAFALIGVRMEQILATISLLPKKGSEAGTSLKNIIMGLALTKTTNRAENFFQEAGANKRNIRLDDFPAMISFFQDMFRNFSPERQVTAASAIVGGDAASAFISLLNSEPKRLQDLSNKILNVHMGKDGKGLSNEIARIMMAGPQGKMRKIKLEFEDLDMEFGTVILRTKLFGEVLTTVRDSLAELLKAFDENEETQQWAKESTKGFILGIQEVATSFWDTINDFLVVPLRAMGFISDTESVGKFFGKLIAWTVILTPLLFGLSVLTNILSSAFLVLASFFSNPLMAVGMATGGVASLPLLMGGFEKIAKMFDTIDRYQKFGRNSMDTAPTYYFKKPEQTKTTNSPLHIKLTGELPDWMNLNVIESPVPFAIEHDTGNYRWQ